MVKYEVTGTEVVGQKRIPQTFTTFTWLKGEPGVVVLLVTYCFHQALVFLATSVRLWRPRTQMGAKNWRQFVEQI